MRFPSFLLWSWVLLGGAFSPTPLSWGGGVALLHHLVLGGAVSLTGFWVVLGTNQFGRSKNSGSPSPEPLESLVLGLFLLFCVLLLGSLGLGVIRCCFRPCSFVWCCFSPPPPLGRCCFSRPHLSVVVLPSPLSFWAVLLSPPPSCGCCLLSPSPLCVVLLCPSPSIGWCVDFKKRGVVAKLCATVFRHIPML